MKKNGGYFSLLPQYIRASVAFVILLLTMVTVNIAATSPAHAATTCTYTQGTNFSSWTDVQTILSTTAPAACPNADDQVIMHFGSTSSITGGGSVIPATLTWAGTAHLKMEGTSSASSILDGNDALRIFESTSTNLVTFSNFALTKGKTTLSGSSGGSGGAISATGAISLDAVRLTLNTVTGSWAKGGAVHTTSGDVTISNAWIESNSSTYFGGAVSAVGGDIVVSASTAKSNTATGTYGRGGFAATETGDLTVSGSLIQLNSSSESGGSIYVGRDLIISGASSTLSNNSAGNEGGFAYAGRNLSILSGATISGNASSAAGGALRVAGDATISDAGSPNLSYNRSASDGGALFVSGSVTTGDTDPAKTVTFSNNLALYSGGAIVASKNVTLSGARFTNNKAGYDNTGAVATGFGGGVSLGPDFSCDPMNPPMDTHAITVTNSKFESNVANDAAGGAIFGSNVDSCPVTLAVSNSSFTGNTGGSGSTVTGPNGASLSTVGAVSVAGDATFTNTTFHSNTAGGFRSIATDQAGTSGNLTMTLSTLIESATNSPSMSAWKNLDLQGAVISGSCAYQASGSGAKTVAHSFVTNFTCRNTNGSGAVYVFQYSDLGLPGSVSGSSLAPTATSILVGAIPVGTYSSVTTDQLGDARTGLVTAGAVQVASLVPVAASLTNLTTTDVTLSPTFGTTSTAYTGSVPNGTSAITLTPTTQFSGATITVNGVAATSGSAANVSLTEGLNTLNVVITVAGGPTLTYQLQVTRAASPTPTPSPSDNSSSSGGNLPSTGGNFGALIGFSALLLLAGASVLKARRR